MAHLCNPRERPLRSLQPLEFSLPTYTQQKPFIIKAGGGLLPFILGNLSPRDCRCLQAQRRETEAGVLDLPAQDRWKWSPCPLSALAPQAATAIPWGHARKSRAQPSCCAGCYQRQLEIQTIKESKFIDVSMLALYHTVTQ